MKAKDLDEIVELMGIVKSREEEREEETLQDEERLGLAFHEFEGASDVDGVRPVVSVDGSYTFLFSFLGADTWIALFRIAATTYKAIRQDGRVKYVMAKPLRVFDSLNVLSFNDEILERQPPVFRLAKQDAEKFLTRKQIIFAANIMTYLENKTLESLSKTEHGSILLEDGALVSVKKLKRRSIYGDINANCKRHDILFAGISKTTSTHFFHDFYADDYFLKKFYDHQFDGPTYIPIPGRRFDHKYQKRFARHGDVHFAKLRRHAEKWFRVDIGNDGGDKDDLFSQLAAHSRVHQIPGYPIGLIETHKVAKSVRKPQVKNYYETTLVEPLKRIGLTSKEILDGAVDIDGEHWRSFHETLDLASK